MPVVSSDFLAGMLTNFRAVFQKSLDEAAKTNALYLEIATKFDSTADQESYGWMGAPPQMSEWTDKRQVKDLGAYDYTLKNKHYEGTIAVSRDTFEDDKYGMIAPRIKEMAMAAMRHINQVMVSQLDDGETLLAYDGTAFFSDSRAIGDSGTIDNLLSGSYSASSAEILAGLGAAYTRMASFKNDKGVAMGLLPDTIVCSPAMYIPILNALRTDVSGETRPEAGIFPVNRVFASPFIDLDADDYYVLCTQIVAVKPLIFQLRKNVEFVALDSPNDVNVFMKNEFLYGVDDRFAAGFGDPRTAVKVHDA